MENISENTVNGTKKFMKVIDNKKIKDFSNEKKPEKNNIKLINKEHENKRILLVDSNGNNLGIITCMDVISIAEEKNLNPIVLKEDDDLVVAKLVNLDKYLYEIKKKIKKNKVANSKNKLKEISYRLVTSNHDLERIKTKIMEWLDKKMKVKVHLQLKGREFNNVDNIRKDFVSFLENLGKVTNISYNKNVGFSAILETKK